MPEKTALDGSYYSSAVASCVSKESINRRLKVNHNFAWKVVQWLRHSRLFLEILGNKDEKDIFERNREDLRQVNAITGHGHFNKDLHMGGYQTKWFWLGRKNLVSFAHPKRGCYRLQNSQTWSTQDSSNFSLDA